MWITFPADSSKPGGKKKKKKVAVLEPEIPKEPEKPEEVKEPVDPFADYDDVIGMSPDGCKFFLFNL